MDLTLLIKVPQVFHSKIKPFHIDLHLDVCYYTDKLEYRSHVTNLIRHGGILNRTDVLSIPPCLFLMLYNMRLFRNSRNTRLHDKTGKDDFTCLTN